MPAKTLYFDESGFTGYNLLDAAQPTFVVSSSDLDDERSEELLRTSFPKYQAAEFKFTNIWTSKQSKLLIDFARNLAACESNAFSFVTDKKFGVLGKLVDYLIEPVVRDSGYDFYADGFCWKYTNYIYYGLKRFAPPHVYNDIVQNYQNFSREPTLDGLQSLQSYFAGLSKEAEHPYKMFIEQMCLGAEKFNDYNDIETFKGSNELHVSSMLAVVIHWRQKFQEDFIIKHDASANFFRRREIWERITGDHVPNEVFPMGDGSLVEFPLRVSSTEAVESKTSYAIQLCDVLAGLCARIFDESVDGDRRKLLNDVIAAGFREHTINSVRPGTVFPDQIPPRKLSGPDAVDKFAKMVFGSHTPGR